MRVLAQGLGGERERRGKTPKGRVPSRSMNEERVTQGTLRTSTGLVLPLERTEVEAKVSGPVATVRVRQVFRNTSAVPIEAVYLFPLPHEASVFEMVMRIGGRTVRGVVKEKEEAKRAYERARSEGRAATLLEQDRPNLFTLSAANVPPGETIEVTLAYQERLAFDDGEWRFVFPMVAPERYAPGAPAGRAGGTSEVPDLGRVRPPSVPTGDRAADVSLVVEVDAEHGSEPRSPSHRLAVDSLGPTKWRVRLHPSETMPNRDFVLAFRDARRGVRADAHFERQAGRPGTFLLVVRPPSVDPEALAAGKRAPRGEGQALTCGNCGGAMRDAGTLVTLPDIGSAWRCSYCGVMVAASAERVTDRGSLPRDVVILVDRSRSMRGGSLEQAKRVVARMLEELDPADAVQIVAFDHERVPLDGRGDGWAPCEPDLGRRVAAFLGGLRARGGTELEQALERAVKLPERPGRVRVVVLLTDAALGNEGRLLRKVSSLVAPPKARLFVLGVGPAVNRYLVDKLARVGGGASDVILPGEDVEIVAGRFARRVGQAGPVLRGLRLEWDDAMPADVYPSPIPDLFGGQPVQLLGRFTGDGPSRLILRGETAQGQPFRQEIDVRLPTVSDEVPGLERLWARARIEARLDRLAQAPDEAGDVRAEVLGLALRHGLMSPYTALIAEDSEVVGDPARLPQRVDVPAAPTAERSPEDEDTGVMALASVMDSSEALDDLAEGGPAEETRAMRGKAFRFEGERATGGGGMRPGAPMAPGVAGFVRPSASAPPASHAAPTGAPPPPARYAPPPAVAGPPPTPAFAPPPGPGGYGAAPSPGFGPPPAPAVHRDPSSPDTLVPPPADGAFGPPPAYGAPPVDGPARMPMPARPSPASDSSLSITEPAHTPSLRARAITSEARKGGGLLGRVAGFVGSLVGGKGDEEDDADTLPPPPYAADAPAPPMPPPPVAPRGATAVCTRCGGRYDASARMGFCPHCGDRLGAVATPPTQQTQPTERPRPTRPEVEPYPAEVIAWSRGRGVGDLDLVFLVDETGSMGPYIAQVKARLLELVDTLRASPLARSLRLGLVTYRDHPPQETSFVSRSVPLTENIDSIRQAVSSMVASGGGDGPEALTDGLVDLVRLDWRPNAARVAVLVGDAPPHGVEPGGDGFPGGCPCGQHWYTQAESCREMGVVVHALGCLPTLRSSYVGAEDVFRAVAKATRGMYLPLDQAQRLVPLVAAVAEAEIDRQRITEHVADVVTAYHTLLGPSDDAERVRFVTDVLREARVRPRALAAPVGDVALPSLRFRDLEPADVEAALEQLRRVERVTL